MEHDGVSIEPRNRSSSKVYHSTRVTQARCTFRFINYVVGLIRMCWNVIIINDICLKSKGNLLNWRKFLVRDIKTVYVNNIYWNYCYKWIETRSLIEVEEKFVKSKEMFGAGILLLLLMHWNLKCLVELERKFVKLRKIVSVEIFDYYYYKSTKT